MLLICIGFFLPWIELNIPLLSLPSLSGINGGLFSWPLLFLALAQAGLVLFEQRLVQWQPVLRSWLHILPLVFGALFVMRACDLITLALGLSNLIQSFLLGFSSASSSMQNLPSLIMPGAGDFLMLLGGLLLMISAGWRLAQAWRAVSVENG
uniref:Uncharacterized protein n=1 Tax=Thermogemmatispora argillosa TaxID=2045280 RepID=A0A455SX67_9CHLR|nr:hypothetical protein KTA_11660 [Thermogemmatispora argillosa]